jgi:hypothetical protein
MWQFSCIAFYFMAMHGSQYIISPLPIGKNAPNDFNNN